jgi:solute carrier family 38 (sodium-coupled neutral amino acid transporter), member 11
MCHHNSFLIYHSMNEVNIKNWKKVTHTSIFVSICFSALFGFVGYLTFTGYTQGDIFENYCRNDDIMNVVRFLYATIIMFTYPLECFVCRDVIENTFFSSYKGDFRVHISLTVAIVLVTVSLSLITDCLGIVLELNVSPIHCSNQTKPVHSNRVP